MTLTIRRDIAADELRRLAAQETDEKVAARMLAISWALDGLPRKEAAEREGMRRPVLEKWVKRYNKAGVDGLRDRPRARSVARKGTLAEMRPDLARLFPEDRNGLPTSAVPFKSVLVRTWQCWSCGEEGIEKYYPRRVCQQVHSWDAGAGVCLECWPKICPGYFFGR